MFQRKKRRRNAPIKRVASDGFPDGLNTVAHPSALKSSELSELINGIYSQYGTISKRQGTKVIGDAASGATEIQQLKSVYNVNNGNDYLLRISDVGKPEYYNYNTSTWDLLTATAPSGYAGSNPTFTAGNPQFDTTTTTWIVQVGSRVYFANQVNELIWLDDDGWHIYTAIADPTTKPTVAKTGSATGSTEYYYQYVWYNEAGNTLASDPADSGSDPSGTGWLGNMPLALDDTTYITLTIPAAPAGAVTTGIFKSNRQGEAFFLDYIEASDTTYVDKGEIATDTFYGVPDENTTAGYHFRLLTVYRGSLVGVTTELGVDTIVWSGALDKFGSWSLTDGAGFYPYRQGDGTEINVLQTHVTSNTDSLFVFKDNVFGKFEFISDSGDFFGEGRVQDVNVAVGSISPFSAHVAGNNLRFWSRDGAASVGNEANYGNILRYSVLSLRADSIVNRITDANISSVCGVFHDSLSIFGVSTGASGTGNNSALVYDERYNAWSLWTGLYPNVFEKHIYSGDNIERLYYGSNNSADVLEMFNGKQDYKKSDGSGTKITLSISTPQYDMGLPDQFKKFDRASFVFGALTGNSTTIGLVKADKDGISTDPRYIITQDAVLSGFGNDEWGTQEVGNMSSDDAGSSVNIRYMDLKQKDMFWVKFNIQNDGIEDELSLLGIYIYYSESTRPLTFNMKLRDFQ